MARAKRLSHAPTMLRENGKRTIVIGTGAVVLVAGGVIAFVASKETAPASSPSPPAVALPPPAPAPTTTMVHPLRRPSSSVVELGVVSERSEGELRSVATGEAVAALVRSDLCGDAAACEAVRATLRDEVATGLRVVASSDWDIGHDADASTAGLSASERARVQQPSSSSHVVVLHVTTATAASQLAIRAAFAAAAAIAERVDGLVYDPLLARVERARDFAIHAVKAPLGASAFRHDRVRVRYGSDVASPAVPGRDHDVADGAYAAPTGRVRNEDDEVVRVVTAGLSRWGAPDIEAAHVPRWARERIGEVVLAVAEAVADGAASGPLALTRDDLARARGEAYPADDGLPPLAPVAIDLVSTNGRPGDPSEFLARIQPPAGEGPMAYLDVAERFFGRWLAASPAPDAAQSRHEKAQRDLAAALAQWDAARARGAKLVVRLPFAIPGGGGVEAMWIDVTRYDGRTISGTIADDPLGATDVARGDDVTRSRSDVDAVRLVNSAPSDAAP